MAEILPIRRKTISNQSNECFIVFGKAFVFCIVNHIYYIYIRKVIQYEGSAIVLLLYNQEVWLKIFDK